MKIIDEPKAIQLHSKITLWLQDNRHLPIEDIVATVKHMLEDAEPTDLLHYAAYSFVFNDCAVQKMEIDDEVSSAHNEVEIARKAEDKARWVHDFITDKLFNVTMDHFESVATQRKIANSKRGEKFKIIEDELKQYWQNNIRHDKRATDAAILLEKTDIYINSATQPKRSSLERYVREWQAEQK